MCDFFKVLNLKKPVDPFADEEDDEVIGGEESDSTEWDDDSSETEKRGSAQAKTEVTSSKFWEESDGSDLEEEPPTPETTSGRRSKKEKVEQDDSWDDDEDGEYIPKFTSQKHKISIAQDIARVLCGPGGGLPIVLSGGAAVTMLGGPREIKDLDFRILLPPDRTFRDDDKLSDGLIKGINKILQHTFENVRPLKRADPKTGMTIKGYVEEVEVSITRTPQVQYMATGHGPQGVPQLGQFDLILDKAYSFIARRTGDIEKKITDLIDLFAILEQQPGFLMVLRGLPPLRGEAYDGQMQQKTKRNKDTEAASSPLEELCIQLNELVEGQLPALQQMARKYEQPELIKRIETLSEKIEEMLKKPPPVILG